MPRFLKHQLLKLNAWVQKLAGGSQKSESILLPILCILFYLGALDTLHLVPSLADTREMDV